MPDLRALVYDDDELAALHAVSQGELNPAHAMVTLHIAAPGEI